MLQRYIRAAIIAVLSITALMAADWKPLFDGKTLGGWEGIGDGVWLVMSNGTLVGERRPPKTQPVPGAETITRAQYNGWRDQQSWLYKRATTLPNSTCTWNSGPA